MWAQATLGPVALTPTGPKWVADALADGTGPESVAINQVRHNHGFTTYQRPC